MNITFYGSFGEMMDDLSRAMKDADARVNSTQAAIKPGQYFINFRHGSDLPIFGEILDIKALGVDEEEQKDIDKDYAQPHMKYYRPTRAYSVACPEGEYGDIHLREIYAIINRELFNFYMEHNWSPPTRKERAQRLDEWLVEEMSPLFQHPDIGVYPLPPTIRRTSTITHDEYGLIKALREIDPISRKGVYLSAVTQLNEFMGKKAFRKDKRKKELHINR